MIRTISSGEMWHTLMVGGPIGKTMNHSLMEVPQIDAGAEMKVFASRNDIAGCN
jgi:hypothetical protein